MAIRGRSSRSRQQVYVVTVGREVAQLFVDREDAHRFASENEHSRVSRHQVRLSLDEAVVIFDRRVVVTQGSTVSDHTRIVRHFVDDPWDALPSADVECYHGPGNSEWHIAGFGVDKAALDARVQDAIDRVLLSASV